MKTLRVVKWKSDRIGKPWKLVEGMWVSTLGDRRRWVTEVAINEFAFRHEAERALNELELLRKKRPTPTSKCITCGEEIDSDVYSFPRCMICDEKWFKANETR